MTFTMFKGTILKVEPEFRTWGETNRSFIQIYFRLKKTVRIAKTKGYLFSGENRTA